MMISFGLELKDQKEGSSFLAWRELYVGMIGASSIWLQNTPEGISRFNVDALFFA
jgi:hypothetical protein